MEEYLKKFGFTPQDIGLDSYFTKAESNGEKITADKTIRESKFNNTMLKNLPLAMAYVPFQQIEGTYDQDEALKMGTLFPNLNKPFLGRKI